MKFGIVGTRTFDDYEFFKKNTEFFFINEIHTGDARGVDSMARKYAIEKDLPLTIHCADWDFYGKAAGPIRNVTIIESVDMILAFWDGKSVGTKQVINHCSKHNIPFIIISTPDVIIRNSLPEGKNLSVD